MSEKIETRLSRFGILDFPCGAERLKNGNTLITDAGDEQQNGSEILEVDTYGQIVWSYRQGLLFPHSAQELNNGNILISDTTNNRVMVVTRDKRVAFDSTSWGDGSGTLSDGSHLNYPNDVHETANGTLLITDRNNDRCIEVSRAGEVLWEYSEGMKHPHNADPLPNGNVLIADSDKNRVIEVDRSKSIVWSYGDNGESESLHWPRDADRLENGNTLIADSKNARVLEVTPEREVVWSFVLPYFANIYDADLLSNGNILISDQQHQRIIEVDRFGNIQWSFRNYRYALPVHGKLQNGGFKRWDQQGRPEGWSLFTRTAEGGGELLKGEDDRGRPCAGIEFDRPGGLCLMQLVAVESGKTYSLGAHLKTEDMGKDSIACLQFAFRDPYGGLFEDVFDSPKGELLTGDTDWFEDSLQAVPPEGATAVELRVLLTGPGRVWVRRVLMLSH